MSKEKKNQETQETTVEIIISEQAKKLADQVEALMKDGKSMAEALQAVLPKSTGRAGIDHVALINSMNNLEELRKAKKTAHAKKSKSKDKPEAAARYQLEIDAATARINELIG
jgi:hypothetical protein